MRLGNGPLVLAALLLWAGCGDSVQDAGGPEADADRAGAAEKTVEPVVVDLGVRPFLTNAPLYVAADEGFFQAEGLRVRFHVLRTLVSSYLPTVERGDLDILALTPSAGLFNIIARGARLRVVADKGNLAPDACSPVAIIARGGTFDDREIGSPAALAGRPADIDPSNSEGFYVETFLRRAGLSLDDIDIKSLPDGARLEALRTGAIDIAGATEPAVTHILDAGHEVFVPVNEIVPGFQWGLLVFGPGFLEDADTGRRFLKAYLRGVRRYREGRTDRNIGVLAQRTGLEPELLRRVCWPDVRANGAVDTVSLRRFQEWALEKGMLDRVLEPEEYLDLAPLRRALEAGGPGGA